MTLIVAPPGYGKTTLLSEWAAQDERPFVWLSLDASDPPAIAPRRKRHVTAAAGGPAALIRRIRTRYTSFVAVFDDAHTASPDAVAEFIEPALTEVPCGSTLVVASRTEPALPVGRLRAHRLLNELRTPQLAMRPREAAALLRLAGVEPETDGVAGLIALAEGWPAALYLAALVLREDPDGHAEVGGQHHLMLDYLNDEVLSVLPPDLMRFSRRTSVLDELSGPSCDAVLGEHRSALLLEQLARLSPLLMPVDPAHHSYRWHQLVVQALRMDLERSEPELVPEIRIRASDWYARRGDTCRAVGQAAAAGAPELTGKLLWPNILDYATHGRNDLVRAWLGNFPPHLIAEHTPLALSAAVSALLAGNVGDALRGALTAGAGLERGGGLHQVDSLNTGVAVIEAFAGHDGVRRMRELATRAAECEPDDSQWQPLCCLLRGVAEYLLGNRDDAGLVLDEGMRLNCNGTPELTCLCLAQRAMIAIDREEWELAVEVSDAALTLVEDGDLMTEPLLAIVFAAAAAARAHAGRIDEAKRDARRGADLLAELGDFVPWYGAEVRILLAHASLWLADAVGARTLLAEASRCARKTLGAVVFSDWFDRAWSYMDTLAESKLTGPSSLTIAELRILRFLPSHRSFREIAAQLGVSANTVKTQAHSVYRKLGAASRSEAVNQARVAGLLGV